MDVRDMLAMMRGFFSDLWRYRGEVRRQDVWIREFAARRGWSVNPHWMMYTNLKLWIIDAEKMFGRRHCPCFEPSGDPVLDKRLVCPCDFAADDIAEKGTCHCTLFGRADMSEADWKAAEARLMDEYRGTPLNLDGDLLDTRGAPIEPRRGLAVPDSLHQVKRALGLLGARLRVIVATQVEADHLVAVATSRGLGIAVEREGDHWMVAFVPDASVRPSVAEGSSCANG